MSRPHFEIPLDLPHAARVAHRIAHRLSWTDPGRPEHAEVARLVDELLRLLTPYEVSDENPAPDEAARVVGEVLAVGRALVDEIERLGKGEDRLGMCVRNLFECLEHGEEGAEISLRAGENPDSLQRPV